jgi:hypothetical protein
MAALSVSRIYTTSVDSTGFCRAGFQPEVFRKEKAMRYTNPIQKILIMGVLALFLVSVPTGNTASQNCILPPSHLIGWWPGDGNANDISGNQQHGTPKGGVSFSQGKVDQAFLFDGIDGRIEIPDSPLLHFGTADLTVDAWIKAPPGTGVRGIIGKEQQNYPFPSIILRINEGILEFAVTDCGTGFCGWYGSRRPVQSPFRVDDDVFHHVAGVRHSSGYELYVDGQLVATLSETARDSDNTMPLFIGIQAISTIDDSIIFPFQGIVDEVEIFDRALGSSEIQALFEAGSAGKCKLVTICHKPGTRAQKTLVIPVQALEGHLGHGDTIGPCN